MSIPLHVKRIFVHIPVLLEEVKTVFKECNGKFLDCTYGGGGHTQAVRSLGVFESFLALDQDQEAIKRAIKNGDSCLYQNFSLPIKDKFGGILADIGFSTFQMEDERGFSFDSEELDMRMNQNQGEPLKERLQQLDEKQLASILYEYGEEWQSRKIAPQILETRPKTAKELADCILRIIPKRGKIHPATKTFQALRIWVNDELNVLKQFLNWAPFALAPKGRLAIITFHSLEDRIVKHGFKALKEQGFKLLTKKPIIPSLDELRLNRK